MTMVDRESMILIESITLSMSMLIVENSSKHAATILQISLMDMIMRV